jgi:hypothetical protein
MIEIGGEKRVLPVNERLGPLRQSSENLRKPGIENLFVGQPFGDR